jgi:hypothetical protein
MLVKALIATLLVGQSVSVSFAGDHGGSIDPNETISPDSVMLSLPIHIGMDSAVSWSFGMMDHASMGHDMSSGMNHDDMIWI